MTGAVTLNAPSSISLFNTVNTTIASAGGAGGAFPSQSLDIEVLGAGNSLTVGNIINGNTVTLHSGGSVLQGNGVTSGSDVGVISDTGSIGAAARPLVLSNTFNFAARAAVDVYLGSSAAVVNGAPNIGSLTIGSVPNLGPGGGTLSGIQAGGNAVLALGLFDVFGSDPVTANNLFISAHSIELDNVSVTSLSAWSQAGGDIDISTNGGFLINNLSGNGQPGISTTGTVNLNGDTGSFTQAAGAAGAISAGSLSVFSTAGVKLDNPANAITGPVLIGSLGNATLVNSIATQLAIGLVGGTLTIQSGGDLQLVTKGSVHRQRLATGQFRTITIIRSVSAFGLLITRRHWEAPFFH